ncbi:hypothetical protein LIER_27441 [Lithospermum erythrorhizon]|uniref:DUF4283 domain-containing protein n=1 Tax=Lithospermum erythrorhizon TaxID=34254 RepID=A0AAV3RF21_LITER
MKLKLSIKGFSMRIFRWDVDFSPNRESAIAPVWIRIEGLPLYMFDEASLLSIANAIGKPLRVHPNNVNRVKLNSALVCVELNVAEPLVSSIWVGFEDDESNKPLDGFWLKVMYDVVPPYCSSCLHIGHGFEVCKKGQVEALNGYNKNVNPKELNQASQVFDNLPQPETFTQTGQIMLSNPQSELTLPKFDTKPRENVVTSTVWQKVKHYKVGVLNGDDNKINLKVQNSFASLMDSEIKEQITGHEKEANIFTEVIAATAQIDSQRELRYLKGLVAVL